MINHMMLHELEEKLKRMRELGADDNTPVVMAWNSDGFDMPINSVTIGGLVGNNGYRTIVLHR